LGSSKSAQLLPPELKAVVVVSDKTFSNCLLVKGVGVYDNISIKFLFFSSSSFSSKEDNNVCCCGGIV